MSTTTAPHPPLIAHRIVRVGSASVLVAPRVVWVSVSMAVVLAVIALVSLVTGTLAYTPAEVWSAIWGQGSDVAVRSIQGRRLPRLLTAILVGGALGVAGGVLQSVSRNVLASPDIIGFTAGASLAAASQILLFGGGVLQTAIAAIVGGILTALIVYGLSRRDGISGGVRLVLVGIGMGALMTALTEFMIVRAHISDSAVVLQWTAGSLTGRGWGHVISLAIAVAILVPILVIVARRVSVMEMGDDVAAALGISVEKWRFAAVIFSVALTSVAVAATGPIAFIALAAPQIARRLARSGGVMVLTSFLTGAMLLTAADVLSQSLDIGLRTPVGLVTAVLGGVYLIFLLARRA